MTEQTEQGVSQTEAAPPRIELEDFIEAVSRGVARALAAQDEVSGYAASQFPGALIGFWFPGFPGGGPLSPFDPNPPIIERK